MSEGNQKLKSYRGIYTPKSPQGLCTVENNDRQKLMTDPRRSGIKRPNNF